MKKCVFKNNSMRQQTNKNFIICKIKKRNHILRIFFDITIFLTLVNDMFNQRHKTKKAQSEGNAFICLFKNIKLLVSFLHSKYAFLGLRVEVKSFDFLALNFE
ncbi:hypothetical protein BpHYR1_047582 [Brachionus plicatilis]|uniref:Uncharacterized protein n=1 Tax=Brachionus plicatilis TaxID=10195 RepID=A0A3M7SQ66_BRAPC|nr:hypothetical protein BpHYR1_047582 [Brachionus plicatilis]